MNSGQGQLKGGHHARLHSDQMVFMIAMRDVPFFANTAALLLEQVASLTRLCALFLQ